MSLLLSDIRFIIGVINSLITKSEPFFVSHKLLGQLDLWGKTFELGTTYSILAQFERILAHRKTIITQVLQSKHRFKV